MGTLVMRSATSWRGTPFFPGEQPLKREARLLDEQNANEGLAARVNGFAEYFVRVLGSVYDTLHAGNVLRARGKVIACFYFGDRPSLSDAEVEALRLRCPVVRYEGNMVLIVRRDEARWWTREMGVESANEVFVDLVKQGY